MQTHFDDDQLARPEIAKADEILRKCVHCGFCTATCPTFVLTGDERDSPRGRIWMMRDMLGGGDTGEKIDTNIVGYHLDRCLTCLSCMTTCPSGVDYMHLVDIGRAEMEKTRKRPLSDRLLRKILAFTLVRAGLFHTALKFARMLRPFAWALPGRLKQMLRLSPEKIYSLDPVGREDRHFPAQNKALKRVILLQGCAQRAINPEINAATLRLLTRLGVDVQVRQLAKCCGALARHMNDQHAAEQQMRATALAWKADIESNQFDAIIVNISGCGTTLKDYGSLMASDSALAQTGKKISQLAMDVTQFLASHCALPPVPSQSLTVAYHAACSLQHGQKITETPKELLVQAGFEVRSVAESHLCCGSAGVYNILQPELSEKLRLRKITALNQTGADIIAAGNLGCMNQLAQSNAPVCHTVELLDWAYGGPKPAALSKISE